MRPILFLAVCVFSIIPALARAETGKADLELIPPAAKIKADHPRLLLRPHATPLAISLEQLRAGPRDEEFKSLLAQLRKEDDASAQAMVWLLTQDAAAAEKAIARMRGYRFPAKVDTFHVFFRLTEFALAYDWLYDAPGFSKEVRAQVRAGLAPLVKEGLKLGDDHVFHNYVWMSSGGLGLWALATAGEDEPADKLFETMRDRFNHRLYPAWRYMDGLPSEPMGYWSLYVFTPGLLNLLAAQSAFETDLISPTRGQQGGYLDRNFETVIHATLPDLRYIPWGDLQSGPNGGVTRDMAGIVDAATWALHSPAGLKLGQWLAGKRGAARFGGQTPIYYFLYSHHLTPLAGSSPALTPPAPGNPPATTSTPAAAFQAAWPALSDLAGNAQGGEFIARSAWEDEATIVGFRCTDHFGDHHHFDQGSFLIYRKGLLAVDPPVYKQTRGPQQKTEYHNALLIGGKPQRPVRGQWFKTIEQFQKYLSAGAKLETGDILFSRDSAAAAGAGADGGPGAGTAAGASGVAVSWAAVAGQYAQAYDCPELRSCVRQILFIRPGIIVIVDQLEAIEGKKVPEVQWQLHVPAEPRVEAGVLMATNGKSWLRCRAILPASAPPAAGPAVEPTPVNTHRAVYTYGGGAKVTLVHVIEVGDGATAGPAVAAEVAVKDSAIEVMVGGRRFAFGTKDSFAVGGVLQP